MQHLYTRRFSSKVVREGATIPFYHVRKYTNTTEFKTAVSRYISVGCTLES